MEGGGWGEEDWQNNDCLTFGNRKGHDVLYIKYATF